MDDVPASPALTEQAVAGQAVAGSPSAGEVIMDEALMHEATQAELFIDKRGHKPRERRCLASGQSADPEAMTRFVLSPDNIVVPDVRGKLPGRGVWVTTNKAALEMVVKNGSFARGFKTKVNVPEDLVAQTAELYRRQLAELLSLTKKSGVVVLGFDQVRKAAGGQALGWRIEARDGAEDGRGKIRSLARAICYEMELPLPGVIACFTASELGQLFGRDSITHAAIPRGRLSKKIGYVTDKLLGFEPLIPVDWPDFEHENRPENRESFLDK